jgi:hypothetical protein
MVFCFASGVGALRLLPHPGEKEDSRRTRHGETCAAPSLLSLSRRLSFGRVDDQDDDQCQPEVK